MELQQLRYVVAVVDEGTFTAAAAACYVSQPSLSHAVATLERELGVELFHRVGRQVALTAAGAAFTPIAREVLRGMATLAAEVAAVRGLEAGSLDLVALPTLAVEPVAPLVGAFRRAHPAVTVRLAHPENSREVMDRLRSGASEVGITELPLTASAPGLVTRTIGRQELVAVLPPGSERPRRLTAAGLARRPLVTQPVGTSTRALLDGRFAAAGVTAMIAVETDQREAIVPLVLAGAGAAVLPRPMAGAAEERGAVVIGLREPLWRELGVVHRDAPLSPAARAFVALATAGPP